MSNIGQKLDHHMKSYSIFSKAVSTIFVPTLPLEKPLPSSIIIETFLLKLFSLEKAISKNTV
jgi:hypothetical protein